MLFVLFFPLFAALVSWLVFYVFSMYLKRNLYRQKAKLAAELGHLVQEQDIASSVMTMISKEKIATLEPSISQHISTFLNQKLQQKLPLVAMFSGDKLMLQAKDIVVEEVMEALPNLLQGYASKELNNEAIATLVSEKVHNISHQDWEYNVDLYTKPLLSKIRTAAAFLGFILGLSYIVFMYIYAYIFTS